MNTARSLLNWTGGKSRLKKRIVQAFPLPNKYDTYVEVFCGSCSVMLEKPAYSHLEAINDLNGQLVNFWMRVREDAEYLQWKLKTLPYAESLFKQYKVSLDNHEELDPIEQAARWYYVNRSIISGFNESDKGWAYAGSVNKTIYDVPSKAASYQYAVETLTVISERLARVQIHQWDFARMIEKYQSPRTLFYCDPPYHGVEDYYSVDGTPPFTADDHRRLAELLNKTKSLVALSYYESPELDIYYPRSTWQRIEWKTYKDTSRMNTMLQTSHEVLLMNYEPAAQSLWTLAAIEAEEVAG